MTPQEYLEFTRTTAARATSGIVAARNVAKLSARATAGTIHGEGDER